MSVIDEDFGIIFRALHLNLNKEDQSWVNGSSLNEHWQLVYFRPDMVFVLHSGLRRPTEDERSGAEIDKGEDSHNEIPINALNLLPQLLNWGKNLRAMVRVQQELLNRS